MSNDVLHKLTRFNLIIYNIVISVSPLFFLGYKSFRNCRNVMKIYTFILNHFIYNAICRVCTDVIHNLPVTVT